MRWIVILILAAVVIAATHNAQLGIRAHVQDLAEFGAQFRPGSDAWFDATVFLASCLVLTPFAALAAAIVGVPIVVVALESTVFLVSRRVGISDGVAAIATMAVGVPVALTQTDLPVWAIQMLGTIARAWIVATT